MNNSHDNIAAHARLIAGLRAIVGKANVLDDHAARLSYAQDNSRRQALPDAVVFVEHAKHITDVVHLCRKLHTPITTRGRATGTAGGAVPEAGGIVLALERMNRILEVDAANRVIRVESGVLNGDIQKAAAEHGLFFGPDPTSAAFCTIGGNLAVNAAGPRALKYGNTRDNTLGLVAVTGAGAIIHTGVYTTKGVVGYDLTRLVIGSEGTLAIISEATLKLIPLPERIETLQAVYRDIDSATAAITAIMASPVTPRSLEFMDHNAIEMVRAHTTVTLPEGAGAMLMIEADGLKATLDAHMHHIEHAATNAGLLHLERARDAHSAAALWATRKALSPALRNIAPNKINEDVVVPVSNIPALISGLGNISRQYDIPIVNFGHAGNGNIHVNLLYDSQDPAQSARALPCLDAVFDLVLSLRGTLSGEHGIGRAKREYINREIDPATLDLMRRIKTEFDPDHILNPDAIFPTR